MQKDATSLDATTSPEAADSPGDGTDGEVASDANAQSERDGRCQFAWDAGHAGPPGSFLLLIVGTDVGNYWIFDLSTGVAQQVGLQLGGVMTTGFGPWVEFAGGVEKMNPDRPVMVLGDWGPASGLDQKGFFGLGSFDTVNSYAGGWRTIAETPTKAYAIQDFPSLIAVLDRCGPANADGGSPATTIVVPGPSPSGVYYDAARQRIWYAQADWSANCSGLNVIALNAATDSIVPGLSYNVPGLAPYSVSHDAKNDRMLVFGTACANGAAANTPQDMRVVELPLATGASRVLLDVPNVYTPSAAAAQPTLLYIDEHHTFVDLAGSGNMVPWDPTSSAVTATSPIVPDEALDDGHGHLIVTAVPAGMSGPIQVISVDENDGGSRTIGSIADAQAGSVISRAIW
jgi:hypothetical protein